MSQTRFPVLHAILTGDVERDRQKAIDDLKLAQHKRQTQAAHAAWKKARELTCRALEVGL